MKLFRCVVLGLALAAVVLGAASLVGTPLAELASGDTAGVDDRRALGLVLIGGLLAGLFGGAAGAGQSRRVFGPGDATALWFCGLAGPAFLAAGVVLHYFATDPLGFVSLGITVALVSGAVLGTASAQQRLEGEVSRLGSRESTGRAAPRPPDS